MPFSVAVARWSLKPKVVVQLRPRAAIFVVNRITMTKNFDLTFVECFGFTSPRAKSWTKLADRAFTEGGAQAKKDLEKSLANNIEASYYRLVGVGVKDLDTDTEYFVSFNNGKKLWDMEISGSKEAEVLPEDKDAFFKSDVFKKVLKQASTDLDRALKTYEDIIKEHLEAGDLLETDETKAEACEHMLKDGVLMKNLKSGKYIK